MILNRLWTPSRVLRKYSTRPPSSRPPRAALAAFTLPPPAPAPPSPIPLHRLPLAPHLVREIINALPSITAHGTTAQLRTVPCKDLQLELRQWRQACATIHSALSGPRRAQLFNYSNQITRIVAHTLRLLSRLQHFRAARELDRAFFTHDAKPVVADYAVVTKWGEDIRTARERMLEVELGDGLGLSRGGIHLAWMQSLALRLEPDVFPTTKEFGSLLQKLHEQDSGGLVHRVTVAFLLQNVIRLASRRSATLDTSTWEQSVEELEGLTAAIRQSKFGKSEMVQRADATSSIRALRTGMRGGLDSREYGRIEELVRSLVEDLEREDARLQAVELGQDDEATSDVPHPPPPFQSQPHPESTSSSIAVARLPARPFHPLVSRARTLHLTADFLLLRAQLGKSIRQTNERNNVVSQSIEAVVAIYSSLLDLLVASNLHTLTTAQAMSVYVQLRQRQSSTLYRLLWACVGTYDLERAWEVTQDGWRDESKNLPLLSLAAVAHVHDVLAYTLESMVTLPLSPIASLDSEMHLSLPARSDPRLLHISSRFWRRFLYTLTVPSAPPSPVSFRTPWVTLRTTLDLMVQCFEHDYQVRDKRKSQPVRRIFIRTSVMIHVTRAVILGGPNRYLQSEQTVEDRLAWFLALLDRLELGGAGETVKRKDFEHAIGVILKHHQDELGGWHGRSKAIREVVAIWADGQTLSADPVSGLLSIIYGTRLLTNLRFFSTALWICRSTAGDYTTIRPPARPISS